MNQKSLLEEDENMKNMRMAADLSGLTTRRLFTQGQEQLKGEGTDQAHQRTELHIFQLVRAALLHYFVAPRTPYYPC